MILLVRRQVKAICFSRSEGYKQIPSLSNNQYSKKSLAKPETLQGISYCHRLCWRMKSLPLHRCGRLGGDVIDNAVDSADLVCNAV